MCKPMKTELCGHVQSGVIQREHVWWKIKSAEIQLIQMLSEVLQLKQFDAKKNGGVTSNTFSINIIKPVLFYF